MPITWNIPLVFLSVLIAMIGSFTALVHAQRMRESSGYMATLWMVAGGCTLGMAVWSMHFVGMLAFHLPVPLAYDLMLILLSALPAIAASLLGFKVLREFRISNSRIVVSGVLMGLGISVMHYTGMAALKMSPAISYNPPILALSVAVAIIASWGALLMMYQGERVNLTTLPRFMLGAAIMSLAIAGMHYVAMLGVEIQPGSMCLVDTLRIEPNALAVLVSLAALFWFGGGILAAMFDRRMARQNASALHHLEQTYLQTLARSEEMAFSMTKSLRESHENWRMVIESAPDAVFITDAHGLILYANEYASSLLGYDRKELYEIKVCNLVAPDSLDHYKQHFYGNLKSGQRWFVEVPIVKKDGTTLSMEMNAVTLPDGRVYTSCRDISKRKQSEVALQQSEIKLRTLYESTSDAVMLLDEKGFIDCNRATLEMFGCATREEFCSKHPADLSSPTQPCGTDSFILANQQIGIATEIGRHHFEWMHQRADNGVTFQAEVLLNAMELDGKAVLQATVRDITARKNTEQQIHQLAFYDSLTRLPNRRLLLDRLHQAFAVGARSGQYGAVLFLDLDNFKKLNDTKGHDIGDQLLIEVARRLESCVRDGDTVARLGGDEFVVVLESLNGVNAEAATQAELVAEKVRTVLSKPYVLKEHQHHTTPSIGIVLFNGYQDSLDDLLKYADIAMYQAKTSGRNAIRFYDPAMQAAIEARANMEDELRLAYEKQQFCLYYQIQVDSLRRPLGAEVLLRWEHPERGLVSPAQFIPLAEETGLIIPIGLWALQTACVQLKEWQHDALTRDLTLAVNVSAKQFRQTDFIAQVQHVLLESGAKPSHLKLELTESIVLENVEDTITKMREIKMLGVGFSMDDFGTGYSSLQYLKRLPLDQIKIDQSFVRDIASDPNDAAIVQTIIAMTDALGLNVIAEGVETEAQCDFLDRHGCHAFQGYLFSKPVRLEQFEILLHSTNLSA